MEKNENELYTFCIIHFEHVCLFFRKLDLDVNKIFYRLEKESIRTTLQTVTQTLVDGKIVS